MRRHVHVARAHLCARLRAGGWRCASGWRRVRGGQLGVAGRGGGAYNLGMSEVVEGSSRGRWLGWVAVAALVSGIGVALRGTLDSVQYQPHSDDGYYLRYMQEVAERGLGAVPGQFTFYLSEPRHWIFPPPSRVGFTLVCALWGELFGVSLRTISLLSLASHLALVVVSFAFAQRWLSPVRAVLVGALMGFSTLHLGLARLALTDVFISLVQVASIGLFIEYLRAPASRWRAVAFASVFAFALLTKEISVLLAIPFVGCAALARWGERRAVPIGRTVAVLVLPVVACVLGWWLAAGDFTTVWRVVKIVLLSPGTNDYALQFGSGGWFRYPVDELLMSPWTTILGLGGVMLALWRWRRGELDPIALALALVYIAQVGVLGQFTKNLRYVAVLEFPLRVLAVGLIWDLCGAQRSARGRLIAGAVVLALCVFAWRDFQSLWLEFLLYDPVTGALVLGREMAPRAQP